MMNIMCFTPFAYCVLAWLLSKYPLHVRGDVKIYYNALLVVAFALLLLSRPLRAMLLPKNCEHSRRRVAFSCMALGTLGELMAVLGAVAVWLDASLLSYIPFFIFSLLYVADFRLLRLSSILDLLPDEPEE